MSFYNKDASNAYLLFDPKYSYLIKKVLDKEIGLQEVISLIQAQQANAKPIWPFKNEFQIRVDSAHLNFFGEQLFDLEAASCPKLSIQAAKLSTNVSMSGVPSKDRN